MLTLLPAPLVGAIAATLYLISIVFFAVAILVIAAINLIPFKPLNRLCAWLLYQQIIPWWTSANKLIMWLTTRTVWDVQGNGGLHQDKWYLLMSNHQTWLDILVLYQVFSRKTPMLKFFMKQELLWTLPVGGLACWVLGYPFLRRHSKDYLKKHPEKKGKDIESIVKACHKLKERPSAVLNYLEGGRFTSEKHQKQNSPFKHLLKPRTGGFAFVLNELGEQLDYIIDVTIIYPDKNISFWDFMCGRVGKIIVRYELIPVDEQWLGNYVTDKEYRKKLHRNLTALWHSKDQLIDELLPQEEA